MYRVQSQQCVMYRVHGSEACNVHGAEVKSKSSAQPNEKSSGVCNIHNTDYTLYCTTLHMI